MLGEGERLGRGQGGSQPLKTAALVVLAFGGLRRGAKSDRGCHPRCRPKRFGVFVPLGLFVQGVAVMDEAAGGGKVVEAGINLRENVVAGPAPERDHLDRQRLLDYASAMAPHLLQARRAASASACTDQPVRGKGYMPAILDADPEKGFGVGRDRPGGIDEVVA
jgi:hypothetical protein